jgi:hypothetical protein
MVLFGTLSGAGCKRDKKCRENYEDLMNDGAVRLHQRHSGSTARLRGKALCGTQADWEANRDRGGTLQSWPAGQLPGPFGCNMDIASGIFDSTHNEKFRLRLGFEIASNQAVI